MHDVRLAQLDRAFGYGPKGRGFESSNAHFQCVYARFQMRCVLSVCTAHFFGLEDLQPAPSKTMKNGGSSFEAFAVFTFPLLPIREEAIYSMRYSEALSADFLEAEEESILPRINVIIMMMIMAVKIPSIPIPIISNPTIM